MKNITNRQTLPANNGEQNYHGRQPLGRNIHGEVRLANTTHPVTKPFSASSDAAWVDMYGDTASISVDGQDYILDSDTWSKILSKVRGEKELSYIEKQLKDRGFFHVSELPYELRKNVPVDTQADRKGYVLNYPAEDELQQRAENRHNKQEILLLPPQIYQYQPQPDEYPLPEDDWVIDMAEELGDPYEGDHLPPYEPDAEPYKGNSGSPMPKDYEEGYYLPPVGQSKRQLPFEYQDGTPELILPLRKYLDWGQNLKWEI